MVKQIKSEIIEEAQAILDAWDVSMDQQVVILNLKDNDVLVEEQIERAKCIVGIDHALDIIFSEKVNANRWFTGPNDNQIFNGSSPLEIILSGEFDDLIGIKQFIEYEAYK